MFETPERNSQFEIFNPLTQKLNSGKVQSNQNGNFIDDSKIKSDFNESLQDLLVNLERSEEKILKNINSTQNKDYLKYNLQSLFQEKNILINSLSEKNEKLEKELKDILVLNSDLNNQIENLDSENTDLSDKIINLSNQINILSEKLEEISSNNVALAESQLNNSSYSNNQKQESSSLSLAEENKKLKNAIAIWERNFVHMEDRAYEMESMEMKIKEQEAEIENLRDFQMQSRLKSENKREFFKGELKIIELSKEIEELQKENERLQQENRENHNFLSDFEPINAEIRSLQTIISNQSSEINSLSENNSYLERIQAEYLFQIEKLNEKITTMEEEAQALTRSKNNLNDVVGTENITIKLLQEELQNATNVLVASDKKIQALKKENSFMKAELARKDEFIVDLQGKQENLDQDIHNLSIQLKTYSTDNERIRKMYEDSLERISDLEKLLRDQMTELEKKENECKRMKKSVESLKSEHKDIQSKSQSLETKISQLEDDLESQKFQARNKDKELRETKSKLKDKDEQVNSLEKIVEKSNSRTYYLEQEISIIKEKGQYSESKVKELSQLLEDSNKIIEDLQERKEKLESTNEKSKREIQNTNRKLNDLNSKLNEAEDKVAVLESENQRLENQIGAEKKKVNKEMDEKSRAQSEVQKLKAVLEEANSLLESQEEAIKATKQELESQRARQQESSNIQENEWKAKFEEFLSERKESENAIRQEMEGRLKEMEDIINSREDQLELGMEEINALRAENENLESYASDLLFEVKKLKLEIEHLSEGNNP